VRTSGKLVFLFAVGERSFLWSSWMNRHVFTLTPDEKHPGNIRRTGLFAGLSSRPYSFLLDSGLLVPELGRYSIMGTLAPLPAPAGYQSRPDGGLPELRRIFIALWREQTFSWV